MISSMQRGGANLLKSESFFSKLITNDRGITYDYTGEPLLYRKPKVKDNATVSDF